MIPSITFKGAPGEARLRDGLRVALRFIATHPDREPGPWNGIIYGSHGGVLVYWTKARAVVVRWGVTS